MQKDTMVKVAVMLLSAVLKAEGHECEVLVESAERDMLRRARELRPDAVAFSCTTGIDGWVLRTAAEVKRAIGIPVVVGGPHPTFFPEMVREAGVDVVCRGEGEAALAELARSFDAGADGAGAANLWVKRDGEVVEGELRPLVEDLDALPFPDWRVYAARYRFMVPYYRGNFPVITSRGCPHRCSYCFNASYQELYREKGRYARRESPESVVRKLEEARDRYGLRRLNLVDDSIAASRSWLRELAPLYAERVALPFICNVRADTVDEESAALLREMGCYCARMGVESGNDRVREVILNKHVSERQIRDAAASIRGAGMKLMTYNIYGSPSETLEEALETLELNRALRVDFAQCSILQPYPGTRICEMAEELGAFEPPSAEAPLPRRGTASYFVSSPLALDRKREMMNLQKLTGLFIRLRVPRPMAERLIRLRADRLYSLLFKLEYAFFRFRLDLAETVPFLRFALRSKAYMS